MLVTSEGVPKLADFNISFSSKLDGATPAAYFGGSLAYMSPEQLEACSPAHERPPDSLDGRSDLYSLAIMLWELLTGQRPFRDEKVQGGWTNTLKTMIERRRAGLEDAAESLLPADCPPGIFSVLRKCLEADREMRWKSGAELSKQLQLCCRPEAKRLVDPPANSFSRRLRPFAVPLIVCAAVLPHVIPGVFNYHYNKEAIINTLSDSQDVFWQIQLVINSIAYPLGLLIAIVLTLRVVPRGSPEDSDPIELARRRRRCLKLGHLGAMLGVTEWVIAGIAYPVSIHYAAGSMPAMQYVHFFGSLVLCGLIAAAYPFFLVAYVSLRVVYPCLLQDGLLHKDDVAPLKQLARRSAMYLGSAGAAPMLGVLAALLVTKNTEVQQFALRVFAVVGFFGFGVIFWIYRRMQADVEALIEAAEADNA